MKRLFLPSSDLVTFRFLSLCRLLSVGLGGCVLASISTEAGINETVPLVAADLNAASSPSKIEDFLTENARFAIDISSRSTFRFTLDEWAFDQFIGIDYAKTFTSNGGDWGTLNLQFYLTRTDNQWRRPYFIEDDDDWELVTRISNFNYTGLADGKLNFRIGHFEMPYGLEVGVNSNGTIRQLLTGRNLGVKADWGVGINGVLPQFKYEVTLSRGTGNEYHSSNQPFVVAGRIGTPDDQETYRGTPSIGVSGFYGDVLGRNSTITNRLRLGVDATTYVGPFTLLGEVSWGQDEDTDIVNGLAEINWGSSPENLTIYTQLRMLNRQNGADWDDAVSSVVGLRFTPDNSWSMSAQLEQEWSAFAGREEESFLTLQARYRF